MTLTGKQRRFLRALGHSLDPVVRTGKRGVDERVVLAVDRALDDHELVKVRLGAEAPSERLAVAELLAGETRSTVAQVLGRTILLYRAHPDTPVIRLPRARTSGSLEVLSAETESHEE